MRPAARLLPPLLVALVACGRAGLDVTPPGMPAIAWVSAHADLDSITIEWSAVEGATGYVVEAGGDRFVVATALSLTLAARPAIDHPITVAAIHGSMEGAPSCGIVARPLGIGTAGRVIRSEPDGVVEGPEPSARFGYEIAVADTNDDGYDDLFVGAPGFAGGGAMFGRGRVSLHVGSPAGIVPAIAWSTSSAQADAGLGTAIATGNVDGIGADEMVLGIARRNFGAGANEGALFWYYGLPADGIATHADACTVSDCEEGASVVIRDVNGDGRAETFAGAPLFDNGQFDEGVVFRYAGATAGAEPSYSGTVVDGDPGSRAGDAIALGDVDGDGTIDLVTGAPLADRNARADSGLVLVCRNAAANGDCPWQIEGGQAGAELGARVAMGDLDGDGYADLAAAAPLWDGEAPDEGRVFVYRGSAAGPSLAADFVLALGGSGARLGWGLAMFDVNRDGFDDVLAGAVGAASEAGTTGIWLGSEIGLASSPSWTLTGAEAGERLHIVRPAGDVNGDGAPDVAIGSVRWNASRGKVSVFHGPPIEGPRLSPPIPVREGTLVSFDALAFTDPASGPKRCVVDFGEGTPVTIDPCDAISAGHDFGGRPGTIRVRVENGYGAHAEACTRVDAP